MRSLVCMNCGGTSGAARMPTFSDIWGVLGPDVLAALDSPTEAEAALNDAGYVAAAIADLALPTSRLGSVWDVLGPNAFASLDPSTEADAALNEASFIAATIADLEPPAESVNDESEDPTTPESAPGPDGGIQLAHTLLAALDPRLGETWEGALLALTDGRPDYPRHVASSVRAVLWTVIDSVSPGEGSHRSRIEALLGSRSRSHLASSCAALVDSVMQNASRLDKAAGPGTPAEAVAVLLAAASAIILLLEDQDRDE